jgi:hypothetical protein
MVFVSAAANLVIWSVIAPATPRPLLLLTLEPLRTPQSRNPSRSILSFPLYPFCPHLFLFSSSACLLNLFMFRLFLFIAHMIAPCSQSIYIYSALFRRKIFFYFAFINNFPLQLLIFSLHSLFHRTACACLRLLSLYFPLPSFHFCLSSPPLPFNVIYIVFSLYKYLFILFQAIATHLYCALFALICHFLFRF